MERFLKLLNGSLCGSGFLTVKVGGWSFYFIISIAFLWMVFQLFVLSPLPYFFSDFFNISFVMNDTKIRVVHLGFACVLAFLCFPFRRRSSELTGFSIFLGWFRFLRVFMCGFFMMT